MTTRTDRYNSAEDPMVKYAIMEECSSYRAEPIPMNFRKLIQVQLSAASREIAEGGRDGLGDNRSMRIKALMTGSIGSVFTIATRVGRIAIHVAFIVPAAIVRLSTATRYNVDGAMKEFFKRQGEEWIDLGVSLISVPVALLKVAQPKIFSEAMERINRYYQSRSDRREAFDQRMESARNVYQREVAEAKAARLAARQQAARLVTREPPPAYSAGATDVSEASATN